MTLEEQIELMKECLQDAAECYMASRGLSDHTLTLCAIAFFQYRAGQRDERHSIELMPTASDGPEPPEPCPSEFLEVSFNTFAGGMDAETCTAGAAIMRVSDNLYYDARRRSFGDELRFNPMSGQHPLFRLYVPYERLEPNKYGVHLVAYDAKGNYTDTHNIFEVKTGDAADIRGEAER